MSKLDAKPDLGAAVAAIGLAVGLATAWLYMAGWTYTYWYFDNFQLGLLTLDISRDTFLIYGFWVLIDHWPWLSVLIVACLVLTIWRPWKAIALSQGLAGWLGLFVVLAFFLLGYWGARATSKAHFAEDQATGYLAARRVEVIADPSWLEGKATSDLATDLAGGCFRLLLKNNDNLFLIRPIKGFETTNQPLLTIPWSEVDAMRILADSGSCS